MWELRKWKMMMNRLRNKMERLTQVLQEQFAESAKLEAEIKQNLRGLGYELIINN